MRVYVTNLNGQSPSSTAQIAQNMVVDIATSLGYRELSIYNYPIHSDTPVEMSKRMDGIIAGLRQGDLVIFQVPTWNTTAFDEAFMNKLKAYRVKVAIFIHDVVPLMFAGNFYLMEQTISYFNKADVIVAPSQNMVDVLRRHGLTVEKVILQRMWDHPTTVASLPTKYERVIHFPGSPERFSFVKEWQYAVPLKLYTWKSLELPEQVIPMGYRSSEQLLLDLSAGGFGLIWMDDHDKEYQTLYCPYKLGTFLAAGIPVIVQRGIGNQEMIEANGLGLVVDSLEEAVKKIETMGEEAYHDLVANVRRFNPLLRQGYFTRKLLTDAVFHAHCQITVE